MQTKTAQTDGGRTHNDIKTLVKVAKITVNHNETMVRDAAVQPGKAAQVAKITVNHNETLVRDRAD